MAGQMKAYRTRLFRGIHAEATKARLDHDALHDLCHERYGVRSMGDLDDDQLQALYFSFAGHRFKRGKLPSRGELQAGPDEMVSGTDLELLAAECAKRGLGSEGIANLTRRQLRGRTTIRTRKDLVRVLTAVRAMNRREGIA
jgi:hypothetical protein